MTNVEGKSDRNSFKVSALVDPNARSDSYPSRPSQTLHTIRHDLPHSQYSVLYNTQILYHADSIVKAENYTTTT
jgi:hypothetical protein